MERDINHIIGGYVRGQLSEEDRAWLEQAMREDAQLAAEVQSLQTEHIIDRYLKGQMNEAEQDAFEKRLATDTIMQEKVKEQRVAQRLLQQYRQHHLADMLEKVATKSKEKKQRRRKIFTWLLLGIMLIGGVMVIRILFPSQPVVPPDSVNNTSSSDTIISSETTPFDSVTDQLIIPNDNKPDNNVNKNRDTVKNSRIFAMADEWLLQKYELPAKKGNVTDVVQLWKNHYRENAFQKVIEILGPVINESFADNDTAYIALGLSYLYNNPPDETQAMKQFDIILSRDITFQEQARWFKALILIRQNNINEATPLLLEIANSPYPEYNKGKAQTLLKSIQSE